jgi:hypothetical protein
MITFNLAFEVQDKVLEVFDTGVDAGNGGCGGQLAENLIVGLTFRDGVGSYLAEDIMDGVGEVLEVVVKVSRLGGGDGVGTEQ